MCLNWALWLRPITNAVAEQHRLNSERYATLRQQWPGMTAHSVGLRSAQRAAVPTPFSALAFQHPQARLARWQPDAHGGEMVLDAQWDSVAATFEHLAERNMYVTAFSLMPKAGVLRFTLQLEPVDDR